VTAAETNVSAEAIRAELVQLRAKYEALQVGCELEQQRAGELAEQLHTVEEELAQVCGERAELAEQLHAAEAELKRLRRQVRRPSSKKVSAR
jgi:septal ring factor EnvC (AmiA/AmiB activator)